MTNLDLVLGAVIEHREVSGVHSVIINNLRGQHIRYPVTTKPDAEYVVAFLKTTMKNAFEQIAVSTFVETAKTDVASEAPHLLETDAINLASTVDDLADEDENEAGEVAQLS